MVYDGNEVKDGKMVLESWSREGDELLMAIWSYMAGTGEMGKGGKEGVWLEGDSFSLLLNNRHI